MTFSDAQRVADAVLYEGYLLYPYRASSVKNQVRWQFGVLMPRGYAEADGSERWQMQTECLVRRATGFSLDLRIRFLRLQVRDLEAVADDGTLGQTDALEVDGERFMAWDEAVEATVDAPAILLDDIVSTEHVIPIRLDEAREVEELRDAAGSLRGNVIRTRAGLDGRIAVTAEDAGMELLRVRVRIENETAWGQDPGREAALRGAMLGVHTLLAVRDGTFISLLEPPPDAADAVAACNNEGTWPVLVGTDATVMLSSPIILYDQPTIAPESPGDLFDATEIDEILTLRIMTLTDEEKREARATDPRARQIIDRSDAMPPEMLERLHGAVRQVYPTAAAIPPAAPPPSPFADPFSPDAPFWEPEARVDPHTATVDVGGRQMGRGAIVRLNPGPRGDSMDMFLAGRVGRIEGVWETLEDEPYVAITLVDDPAAEEHAWVGRFLYFRPTELEPAAVEAGR
ncbi:MAG: hypothetical protein M3406_07720 [Chloroflexota bacterium]|nr:hypothetical protein [Chloroflexota bacterium]